mgnify:CR=1 FL=1
MSEEDYHNKRKVLDADWRRENKVTIKSFIDLVLDTFAPRGSKERNELNTLGRSPKWAEVIEWADELQWFNVSSRERSPRGSPRTPPGPPGDPASIFLETNFPSAPPSPARPPPSQPKAVSKPAATDFVPGQHSAVPPPANLYQEVWFDAHSREEECLPPFSYLSHFLTMLLLSGGCGAFYSFLQGAGVTNSALQVFSSAISETAMTVRPAASLTARTFSAACDILSSTTDFVFSLGSSLSRMSGPLLNLFYTVYPLAVIRRGKGVKDSIDSVINDAESVFTRLSTLRHGVSDARDRRIVEARVRLSMLKKHKAQLKNKLREFITKLVGGTKSKYNRFQGNICQALMEIYGGKRRGPRIDSVQRVNVMFEKAFTFNASHFTSMVLPRRPTAPPRGLTRGEVFDPAVQASLRARNVSPKDDMEEAETADSFITQFSSYHDASGPRRRTRKRGKGKGKGKRVTRVHKHKRKMTRHRKKHNKGKGTKRRR